VKFAMLAVSDIKIGLTVPNAPAKDAMAAVMRFPVLRAIVAAQGALLAVSDFPLCRVIDPAKFAIAAAND
jgi:hypothetical protein